MAGGWWLMGTGHLIATPSGLNDATREKSPDPRGETLGGQLADKYPLAILCRRCQP